MKQTIRYSTFETNSSSYHTITIGKRKDKGPLDDIVKGNPTMLSGIIKPKHIGYTSSYSHISRNKLEKANMLLRYIAAQIDYTWIYDQEAYDQLCDKYKYHDPEYREEYIKIIENYLPLKTLKKVISDYTGEETIINYRTDIGSPYIEVISDDNQDLADLLGLHESEMEDEDLVYAAISWIVLNDEVEITEECESNE